MSLRNKKHIKGMIFAGCSFTWGQGLNYYNDFPTNVYQPIGKYDKRDLSACQIKFIEKNRFPRLVANHFDSYEFVRPQNGGSNKQAINFFNINFNQCREIDSEEAVYVDGIRPVRIDPREISHIIFQLTQPERDNISITFEDQTYDCYDMVTLLSLKKELLDNYLTANNIDLDVWIEEHKQKSIQRVKDFLVQYEEKGIKTIVTTWPYGNLDYINQDEFLKKRLLSIRYNNDTFYSFDDLMGRNEYNEKPYERSEMVIRFDYENFTIPPGDLHISKKAHKVIADSIIEHIENDREIV